VAEIRETRLPGLALFRRGKVRDTFELDDGTLLMVATDRISAFDVVLPTPIPDKGRVLTQISRWWFEQTASMIPNHLLPDRSDVMAPAVWEAMAERSMRCQRAQRRMNQLHGRFTIANEDFLYVLSTFVFGPIRWNARFGWRSRRLRRLDGHLVAGEVCGVRLADQRVDIVGFAYHRRIYRFRSAFHA